MCLFTNVYMGVGVRTFVCMHVYVYVCTHVLPGFPVPSHASEIATLDRLISK